ncbi:hypothetical protein GCM10010377_76590 [Streptomyces viridiviolaceus]|uniref:Uncharacterized protein n=1 Tax=Streptomyces viridiviolaceus TaxID=68282 RepID=A0ABW2EB41_9ACTN|nr:hypothetical protein [Streptomyces viridiviolaceus]GHB74820.1 hypothetical protein GCM10010377_76590 [Streptomyces viridiviolaceus]
MKEELGEVLTGTLDAIEDPETTPEERARYTEAVQGLNEALEVIQDPNTTPEDRARYMRVVEGISEALSTSLDPNTSPGDRVMYTAFAGYTGSSVTDLQSPETRPEHPEDREQILRVLEETSKSLVTAQDPNASPEKRDEARRKMDQWADSLDNSQYLALMKEVKQYKPPTACIDTIENRTRQAGWPEGSLWGLSSSSCAATLSEAAHDSGSKWSELFRCVQRDPFSTCAVHIPKS